MRSAAASASAWLTITDVGPRACYTGRAICHNILRLVSQRGKSYWKKIVGPDTHSVLDYYLRAVGLALVNPVESPTEEINYLLKYYGGDMEQYSCHRVLVVTFLQ